MSSSGVRQQHGLQAGSQQPACPHGLAHDCMQPRTLPISWAMGPQPGWHTGPQAGSQQAGSAQTGSQQAGSAQTGSQQAGSGAQTAAGSQHTGSPHGWAHGWQANKHFRPENRSHTGPQHAWPQAGPQAGSQQAGSQAPHVPQPPQS